MVHPIPALELPRCGLTLRVGLPNGDGTIPGNLTVQGRALPYFSCVLDITGRVTNLEYLAPWEPGPSLENVEEELAAIGAHALRQLVVAALGNRERVLRDRIAASQRVARETAEAVEHCRAMREAATCEDPELREVLTALVGGWQGTSAELLSAVTRAMEAPLAFDEEEMT